MGRRRSKNKQANTLGVIVEFAETVDTVFEKLTGKNISAWLKEFQQQPRELPPGEQQATPSAPVMPLADAYAILGLPQTASLEEVKGNYRRLAVIFHPDKGGYTEAMRLLNDAYRQITRGGK